MTLKYAQMIVLATVFLFQYAFEHIYPQRRQLNDWKHERINVLIGLLNIVLALIPAAGLVQLLQWIERQEIGLLQWWPSPLWIQVIVTIILMDLWMYCWHRMNHTVAFFWRFHLLHHRDTKMNTTTALRFHIIELLLSYPGKALICVLFGISYMPLVIYEVLFFISIVIHHSNIRISEKTDSLYRILFVSPIMHRIHHSRQQSERNSNYGALFSFWDRIFCTRKQINTDHITFGVEE
jgi:sterol desaturase/sphingolipid hydroxylase (fatty acid hydroxylase superfamily)